MVTVASGDKYRRACRCHRGSPRRHECAPALRRLQVLVLAPPQASERQDRRIHELGSLSFFSLCGEADSILSLRFSGASAKQIDLAEDRRRLFHPCFATRLGGVSGGKESQGWRDSSHTAMVGAGKFGSAKLPMATATYPGKPSPSQ